MLEQEWVEELNINDLVDGQAEDSASGGSEPEDAQVLSASRSQRLLIQSLTEMGHSAFKRPCVPLWGL